jgi:hypothetical protein
LVEFTKVTDEMRVADIFASWSIEELRQLIVEIDAELLSRLVVPLERVGLMPRVDRADARTGCAADPAVQLLAV